MDNLETLHAAEEAKDGGGEGAKRKANLINALARIARGMTRATFLPSLPSVGSFRGPRSRNISDFELSSGFDSKGHFHPLSPSILLLKHDSSIFR